MNPEACLINPRTGELLEYYQSFFDALVDKQERIEQGERESELEIALLK